MPVDIKINRGEGKIEIRSYGDLSQRDMESAIANVLQMAKESGIYRVLVDATQIQSFPNTTKIFKTFSFFPQELKVAVIVDKNQPTANDIRFVETVTANRGRRFQTFLAIPDAVEWLDE